MRSHPSRTLVLFTRLCRGVQMESRRCWRAQMDQSDREGVGECYSVQNHQMQSTGCYA
jgi:hypothetical protein